ETEPDEFRRCDTGGKGDEKVPYFVNLRGVECALRECDLIVTRHCQLCSTQASELAAKLLNNSVQQRGCRLPTPHLRSLDERFVTQVREHGFCRVCRNSMLVPNDNANRDTDEMSKRLRDLASDCGSESTVRSGFGVTQHAF